MAYPMMMKGSPWHAGRIPVPLSGIVRTPMPIQNLLPVTIPQPFDTPPQGVNSTGQFLLTGRPVDKIRMGGKQSLSQKGRLNKVASVVLEAERFHPACLRHPTNAAKLHETGRLSREKPKSAQNARLPLPG